MIFQKTPRQLGYRFPAEWEPQQATWLSWPHKEESWPDRFAPIPDVFTEIVRILATYQHVNINIIDRAMQERVAGGATQWHDAPLPREREKCLACHAYDGSRPNGFPQVDPSEHKPNKKCVSCHDPHDPVPPKAPQDCAGCHGRIQQTKALSTHATVACAACHVVDERHMTEPRLALPTKPEAREVCGRCHAAGSTDPEASRQVVDLAAHGGTYVCWECHYAHLPEGRK